MSNNFYLLKTPSLKKLLEIDENNLISKKTPNKVKKIIVSSNNEQNYTEKIKKVFNNLINSLPLNIPRSVKLLLICTFIIPVLFSLSVFIPNLSSASNSNEMLVSQIQNVSKIFKNLNFNNELILRSQLEKLIQQYEKYIKLFPNNPELIKMAKSRIQIANYILENITNDMFLDVMIKKISDNFKIKPYFSYNKNKTICRADSLGRWATLIEEEHQAKQVEKFLKEYPKIYEKNNKERLEKINDLIDKAVLTYAYVPNFKQNLKINKSLKQKNNKDTNKNNRTNKKSIKKSKNNNSSNLTSDQPKPEKKSKNKVKSNANQNSTSNNTTNSEVNNTAHQVQANNELTNLPQPSNTIEPTNNVTNYENIPLPPQPQQQVNTPQPDVQENQSQNNQSQQSSSQPHETNNPSQLKNN